MTTYFFDDIVANGGTLNGFDPLSDVLVIGQDGSRVRAIAENSGNTSFSIYRDTFSYQSAAIQYDTIVLTGVPLHQLTNANVLVKDSPSNQFTFEIGDNSPVSDNSGDNQDNNLSSDWRSTLLGLGGNDTLTGGRYRDGGEGDDMLDRGGIGGPGADSFQVWDGDTISYLTAKEGIYLSLTDSSRNTGDAQGDQIPANIQLRIFGSDHNDTLEGNNSLGHSSSSINGDTIFGEGGSDLIIGNNGSDLLFGGPGNDTLRGGHGDNDILVGGPGADYLDGGDGAFDSVSYLSSRAGIVAIMDPRYSQWNAGDAAGDQYLNIRDMFGSNFDDVLAGDDNGNQIIGEGGDDAIYGLGGNDTLSAFFGGIDTLYGGDGGDLLTGSESAFAYAGYDFGVREAITVSLSDRSKNTGQAEGDFFTNIRGIVGSRFGDTLEGDNNHNHLVGQRGNDLLRGLGGDDTLTGGLGKDTLSGSSGFDYADYDDANGAVVAILQAGYWNWNFGFAAGDEFAGIEGVIGSRFDDGLAGNQLNNELIGGSGDDLLIGVLGDDTLIGGDGNDTLRGHLGNGGGGDDRFEFSTSDDQDVIEGFDAGAGSDDVIALSIVGFDTFSDVQSAMSDVTNGTLINFGGGDQITLVGVNSASLHADDFVFV